MDFFKKPKKPQLPQGPDNQETTRSLDSQETGIASPKPPLSRPKTASDLKAARREEAAAIAAAAAAKTDLAQKEALLEIKKRKQSEELPPRSRASYDPALGGTGAERSPTRRESSSQDPRKPFVATSPSDPVLLGKSGVVTFGLERTRVFKRGDRPQRVAGKKSTITLVDNPEVYIGYSENVAAGTQANPPATEGGPLKRQGATKRFKKPGQKADEAPKNTTPPKNPFLPTANDVSEQQSPISRGGGAHRRESLLEAGTKTESEKSALERPVLERKPTLFDKIGATSPSSGSSAANLGATPSARPSKGEAADKIIAKDSLLNLPNRGGKGV